MDVNELRRQHQNLRIIASRLLSAVKDSGTQQSVGAIRWHLAREVMAHLAVEDRLFYPAMQRVTDERARKEALRLQAETGMLAKDFSAYMYRWSDDQVARQWSEFCVDTRQIITRLAGRMDQEERLLFPLAEMSNVEAPPIIKAS